MLRALLERGIVPDLVLGTSVGALNGAMLASSPTLGCVEHLAKLWGSLSDSGVFSSSLFNQAARLAKHRTHLHSAAPLRRLLEQQLPGARIEDLAVPFQCVAASIERARATWFSQGPVADAVLASCAVPGLLPPARIGDEHFLDGGLVHSIPFGRAVQLGAREIYVLHVGRVERALRPPQWPWEVGLVSFEIARRSRFMEDLADIADDTVVHLLPSGQADTPLVSLRYRSADKVAARVESAYRASVRYLDGDRSVR
jgi:NTE family protein